MKKVSLQNNPYPLGVHCENDGLRFAFVSMEKSCGINIYQRESGVLLDKIKFSEKDRIGNVFNKTIECYNPSDISYLFWEKKQEEEVLVADPYARAFVGMNVFGVEHKIEEKKAIIPGSDFNWGNDVNPMIPYPDCIAYQLHVRGFTMDEASGVKNRGTFSGLIEKLPYLLKTGVTTVELQPAYEFEELSVQSEKVTISNTVNCCAAGKLNYWGYKEGFYYAPKSAYAASDDPVFEFKNMVRMFHKKGLEIVMQFYFPSDFSGSEILDVLRFWVLEYHVDGFHLIGERIPAEELQKDPMLAFCKLWFADVNSEKVRSVSDKNNNSYKNLAVYNDDYLYVIRKFLRGEEDMLSAAMYQMRHIPQNTGRIHYLTNYNTFTIKDMVSYDYKHNEANFEGNKDGNAYNFSWNCGEEGESNKKSVKALRKQQIKNAICLLLFTQSTPLIFMGDEFGNSQNGNNNPYCQDNKISWLNWKEYEKNRDIYQFWQKVIRIRKDHPILRPINSYRLIDYIMCGYPDLSYHGDKVWRPDFEPNSRYIGQLICGKYAGVAIKDSIGCIQDDVFFYLKINMHSKPHVLDLPKLPDGNHWEVCVSTSADKQCINEQIDPRSIVIYKSVKSITNKNGV